MGAGAPRSRLFLTRPSIDAPDEEQDARAVAEPLCSRERGSRGRLIIVVVGRPTAAAATARGGCEHGAAAVEPVVEQCAGERDERAARGNRGARHLPLRHRETECEAEVLFDVVVRPREDGRARAVAPTRTQHTTSETVRRRCTRVHHAPT